MELARSGCLTVEDKDLDYLPDLDLIPLDSLSCTAMECPKGFLVCCSGPNVKAVREGDLITAVLLDAGERSLVLGAKAEEDLVRRAEKSPGGVGVDKRSLIDFSRQYGLDEKTVEKLFDQLDAEESGWADARACCTALDGELAKALFGMYASEVRVRLWRRPDGSGAYEEVAGGATLLRTRDARRRAEATTPGRWGPLPRAAAERQYSMLGWTVKLERNGWPAGLDMMSVCDAIRNVGLKTFVSLEIVYQCGSLSLWGLCKVWLTLPCYCP